MHSSIFSSDVLRGYLGLPRATRWWHLWLALSMCAGVAAGKHVLDRFLPTTKTLAVGALDGDTEVLFVGSSRVERDIDPRLYGVRMVNLSGGGLGYSVIEPIVLRALERAPNVRAVIVEADIFLLRADGVGLHWGDGILYELGLSVWDLPAGFPTKARRFLTQPPVFLVNRLTPAYLFHPFSPYPDAPRGQCLGHRPFDYERDLATDPDIRHHGPEQFVAWHSEWLAIDHSGENLPALLRLFRELKERNIQAVLVVLPHLPAWTEGIPEEWHRQMREMEDAVRAEMGEGASVFWNFSSAEPFDLSYFHDGLHLNQKGVEALAVQLDPMITSLVPREAP